MFNLKKKVLFGVAASMVLAMAIGSFALSETQTPASPRAVEAQSLVGATAGPFTVIGGTQGTDYDFTGTSGTDGVLKIHPQSIGTNITISNTGTTTDRIEVTSAATITLAGVNIDRSSITTTEPAALTIIENANFDVKILLADSTTNILKGAAGNSSTSPYPAGSPGIEKNGEGDSIGTLTIGAPDGSAGTGNLEATGGAYGAGIGGGNNGSGSNITITGGVVTATGGEGAAGIGGGGSENGSNITISGGKVTANGGENGAGIGGGYYSDGSNITISGGEIIATGGKYGAGIGGGQYGNGSNITITVGEVKAIGNACGSGIGGGYQGEADGITISGGEVTANGGEGAAGIGGGSFKSGSSITISGGVVTATGGKYAAGIGSGYPGSGSVNNILNGDAVVLATSGDTSKAALEGFDSLLTKGIAFTGLGTAFDDKGRATDVTWDSNGTMYGNVTLSQDLEIPSNLTVSAGQILSIKEGKDVTLSEEDGAKYTVEGELRNNGIVTLPDDLEVNDEGKVTTAIIYDTQGGRIANADEYKTYQDSSEIKAYSELPNAEKDNCIFEGWYTEKDGEGTKIEETSLVLLNQHVLYANWTANPGPTPEPTVDPGAKTGDSFAGIAALAILGVATTGTVLLRKRK